MTHLSDNIIAFVNTKEGGKPPAAKAGNQRKLAVFVVLSVIGVEPSRLLSGSEILFAVRDNKTDKKGTLQCAFFYIAL